MPERVSRVDVGARIRADMVTAQGGARIPARLTRTGVLLYPQPDGTVRREYRPPSEVFDAASMRTLETSAVTVGHPRMVTPADYKQLNVGQVIGPRRDGRFLGGDVAVNDAATLTRVNLPADDPQALFELSCGYTCELELTAGTTPEGDKYDAIQRSIIYNHVALLPRGAARAGSEVRLRLDEAGVSVGVLDEGEEPCSRPRGMPSEKTDDKTSGAKDLEARLDALTANFEAERKRVDGLQKDLDKVTAQRDELQTKLDAAEKKGAPEAIDAAVRDRISVLDGARILHGKDVENKGTDVELMVSAIKARDDKFDAAGKSADYIRARFDAKVEDVRKANGALGDLNRASGAGGSSDDAETRARRVDEDADPIAAVQAHNDAWQQNAWARPNRNSITRGSFAAGGR